MFYVYLLKSRKDNDLYIGFTNNLKRRVQEHNNGLVASTKLRRPFELIHSATNPDACHRGRKAVSPKGLKTAGLSLSVSTLSIRRINLENKPRCKPIGVYECVD